MNLACIVEDTEQTPFCAQMDKQTEEQMDGQLDKVKPVYPHFNFLEVVGVINK